MPTVVKSPVLFSGENPGIRLVRPGTSDAVALASYWRCTYSAHGEGDVLILWIAPGMAGLGEHGLRAIYTDNVPMARFVTDTFNQYFGGYQEKDFPSVQPETARFLQESGGDRSYRVVCYAADHTVELVWRDVISRQLMIFSDTRYGDRNFDTATVMCPCAGASITIDGQAVSGDVQPTEREGRPWSSAFLAFAETWTENLPAT
jgi:hypothetical protein